jgi:hypothetical protein
LNTEDPKTHAPQGVRKLQGSGSAFLQGLATNNLTFTSSAPFFSSNLLQRPGSSRIKKKKEKEKKKKKEDTSLASLDKPSYQPW